MKPSLRLTVSAVVAAVVFGVGYFTAVFIPGVGGATKDADFTNFYNSDGKLTLTAILVVVLIVGCLALLWFFNELRARLPDDVVTRIAYSAAMIGVIAVPAGVAIMSGPAAVQQNSNDPFVGISVANAFAQAGLLITLALGMYSFALSAILWTIAAARQSVFPKWLAIAEGVLAVVTLGSFFWIPGYAFVLWVLVAGVAVGLRDGTSREHAAPMRESAPVS